MSLAVKQTLIFPGPTVGITVLGSVATLTSFYDVVSAPASNEQIAILSISAGYNLSSPSVDSSLVVAYGDSNTVLLAFDTGARSSDHGTGYRYPPLLPAGEKLSIKALGGTVNGLVVYIQYMIVPV